MALWPWLTLFFFAPAQTPEPVKTTLCEITAHPENYDGKLVQIRALVESGVDDLPAGVADDKCGAEVKFFTPDDQHFAQLLKSKAFRKLVKDVSRKPFVEATVTGWFRRPQPDKKMQAGLALESVEDVSARPLPKSPHEH
ncbi:MAG TPA: hypothetical protein VMI94_14285 [Bryobacteraceae bacterium]|nr:hypothetical protein [Bryobacteraceae bacterium]